LNKWGSLLEKLGLGRSSKNWCSLDNWGSLLEESWSVEMSGSFLDNLASNGNGLRGDDSLRSSEKGSLVSEGNWCWCGNNWCWGKNAGRGSEGRGSLDDGSGGSVVLGIGGVAWDGSGLVGVDGDTETELVSDVVNTAGSTIDILDDV
jgi:hypothetical protein